MEELANWAVRGELGTGMPDVTASPEHGIWGILWTASAEEILCYPEASKRKYKMRQNTFRSRTVHHMKPSPSEKWEELR